MTTLTREFTFLKVRPSVQAQWAFPHALEVEDASPFAGVLSREQVQSLEKWVGLFPFAQRLDGRHRWFRILTPQGERAECWLTSDGQIWASGAMRLIYALFVQLQEVCPELLAEEPDTGMFHDRDSLMAEARMTPVPWRAVA